MAIWEPPASAGPGGVHVRLLLLPTASRWRKARPAGPTHLLFPPPASGERKPRGLAGRSDGESWAVWPPSCRGTWFPRWWLCTLMSASWGAGLSRPCRPLPPPAPVPRSSTFSSFLGHIHVLGTPCTLCQALAGEVAYVGAVFLVFNHGGT